MSMPPEFSGATSSADSWAGAPTGFNSSTALGNLKPPPKVTYLPILVGLMGCLCSSLILIFFRSGNLLIYVAYVCTPFIPIIGLVIARSIDIRGRTNIRFDIAKSNKILRFASSFAILGFILSIGVVYQIALRHAQI
jgi:hypothetical protein